MRCLDLQQTFSVCSKFIFFLCINSLVFVYSANAENNRSLQINPDRIKYKKVEQYLDDSSTFESSELSSIIEPTPLGIHRRLNLNLDLCGPKKTFDVFYEKYGFLQFQLDVKDLPFLRTCVFKSLTYLDINLKMPVPGYYRRYEENYVNLIVSSGFACGYRTRELLTHYAAAVWFFGKDRVFQDSWFRCLGDQIGGTKYTVPSIRFGINRILDKGVQIASMFDDFRYYYQYLALLNKISANSRKMQCSLLESGGFDSEELSQSDISKLVDEYRKYCLQYISNKTITNILRERTKK